MSGGRKGHEIPAGLLSRLRNAGARVDESRTIDHATQHRLSLGSSRVTLNVYSTGKISEGGKESALKEMIRDYRLCMLGSSKGKGRTTSSARKQKAETAAAANIKSGFTVPNATPRVGTDEAGKGEYFGPLVVAGVRVLGNEQDEALRQIGVRDSKALGLSESRRMADEIVTVIGSADFRIACLSPRKYDSRWRSAGSNVNRLLGELNVEVIGELKSNVEVAVVDAFGPKAGEYVASGGIEGVRIEARPRAEDDAAVAAASILARSRYLEEMDRLSDGAGFTLPRGSTHVVEAARRIYAESGEEGLREVAKFHFSITDKIIGA